MEGREDERERRKSCWVWLLERYHEVPVILLLDSFDSDKLQQVVGRGNVDDLLTTKSFASLDFRLIRCI